MAEVVERNLLFDQILGLKPKSGSGNGDGNADNGSGGGTDDANASNNERIITEAPVSTANGSQTASGESDAAVESKEITIDDKKPEAGIKEKLSAQELAAREVQRILGAPDQEAEAAARSKAAGGFVSTSEAAISSIVNTNAQNLNVNPTLQETVMAAAQGARGAGMGNMLDVIHDTGHQFGKQSIGEDRSRGPNVGVLNA